MSDEEQDYIGYEENIQVEEQEKKPKTTFNDIIKEGKQQSRKIKPAVYFILHFFIAFGVGSVINYLVSYKYIKPANVNQIIVSTLVFIYLRLNTHIGGRK